MTNPSDLTGKDNYFEDFVVGAVTRHARGKTIEAAEHVILTNLVMNSAQGHFNEEAAKATPFGRRMTFGGYTAALVIGLSSQDTSENALAELSLHKIRFGAPVFAGDTIIAFTEVLSVSDVGRSGGRKSSISSTGASTRTTRSCSKASARFSSSGVELGHD